MSRKSRSYRLVYLHQGGPTPRTRTFSTLRAAQKVARAAFDAGRQCIIEDRLSFYREEYRFPRRQPKPWSEFSWPEWVPQAVRVQIEDFWGVWGRDYVEWQENAEAECNHSFPLGTVVKTLPDKETPWIKPGLVGRFVHAWNNMGRICFDDGPYEVVATFQVEPVKDAA